MKLVATAAAIVLAGLLLVAAADSSVADVSATPPAIDPALAVNLASRSPDDVVSVIVYLKEQADVRAIGGNGSAQRQRRVIEALRKKADATQGRVRALLQARRAQGSVQVATPLWIVNAVAVTARSTVIQELGTLPEVRAIVPDVETLVPASVAPVAAAQSTPEANLSIINAPALWDLGFRGQGVVVASMDSGVDYTHPDLAGKWRGGSNSWYDPWGEHPTVPTDFSGHGTSTMGVIVGGDSSGTAIGLAPEASWIAVKIFNDRGIASTSVVHQGFQWLLDPDGDPLTADAPDIVNNSWSFSSPGCNLDFEPDLQSLVAAGITPVFAAGNYGPNGSTSASPGNNPSAFAVGATNNSDVVSSFSSCGPTSCGNDTPRTYPSVVAPGVNIRTTDLYGLYTSASGTSLSAPHVTGALALLLGARPSLTVDQQRAALSTTAVDLGPAGPDDAYGDGRIDVLAAYNSLAGTPPADSTGPVASIVSVIPTPTNGAAGATLSATVNGTTTGGANVAAAEYFIDVVGADGAGTAMSGAFASPTESVSAAISPATLAALSEGAHSFYVHGQDALGNWGATQPASLVIDRTGPATSGVSGSPNPTGGAAGVILTGTAADGGAPPSNVVAAEWFEGADPGVGSATSMAAADGTFDGPTEGLTTSINVSAWTVGNHTVSVRALDAAGNWGAVSTTTLSIQALDVIFSDGFESGNFSAWSSAFGAGTRISVTGAAVLQGSFGMQAVITGNTPGYVTDNTPANESSYHARFYFDPNSTITRGSAHDIFVGRNAAGTTIFRVQYRRTTAGLYQIRTGVLRSGGTTYTGWQTISDAPHAIEIAWQSATSASFSLYIDGALKQTLTGLNTSAYRLESARLGPSAGLTRQMSGTEYFDSFVSNRHSYIGLNQ